MGSLLERFRKLAALWTLLFALAGMFRKPRLSTGPLPRPVSPPRPIGRGSGPARGLTRRASLIGLLAIGAIGAALIGAGSRVFTDGGARYSSAAADIRLPASFLSGEPSSIYAPLFLQDPSIAARYAGRSEYIWPVEHGWITDLFTADHPGVDVGFEHSPPVLAARAGTVVFVGGDPCCGKGLYVEIEHDDGWSTVYGHLDGFSVEVGQEVRQGDEIGIGGSTGNSTGPHVHLELHQDGYPVDPMYYFPADMEIRLEPDATGTPTETGTPGPEGEAVETPTPAGGQQPTETPGTAPAPPTATLPPAQPTITPGATVAGAP